MWYRRADNFCVFISIFTQSRKSLVFTLCLLCAKHRVYSVSIVLDHVLAHVSLFSRKMKIRTQREKKLI